MRALSLTQPWAWAVAEGLKTVENRGWACPPSQMNTEFAIHASKKWDADGDAFLRSKGIVPPAKKELVYGAIVGITRCIALESISGINLGRPQGTPQNRARIAEDPMFFGEWGWLLEGTRKLETPLPMKGMLGMWEIPTAKVGEIYAALPQKIEATRAE